jgi:hypothetical protein
MGSSSIQSFSNGLRRRAVLDEKHIGSRVNEKRRTLLFRDFSNGGDTACLSTAAEPFAFDDLILGFALGTFRVDQRVWVAVSRKQSSEADRVHRPCFSEDDRTNAVPSSSAARRRMKARIIISPMSALLMRSARRWG